MEAGIQTKLEGILREQRRLQLWRGLAWCWLGAGLAGLGLMLIYRTNGVAFAWSLPVLLFLAVVASFLIRRAVMRVPLDLASIARGIEQANPQLRTLLLAAMEQRPDPVTGQWSYLQQRVIVEALEENRKSPWGQKVSERLFFAQCGQWGALLFFLVVLLGLPTPKQARYATPVGLSGVAVTPGSVEVERGNSLPVLARFGGRLPSEVTLVMSPDGAPPVRIQLLKSLDDPVFGGSVPDIQKDFAYRVEYSGTKTEDYQVKVFEYPRLDRADAQLTFPAYTGLGEKRIEDTRRVSAVEGTRLDYSFQLNKPVASAKLIGKDKSALSLVTETNRAVAALTNFLMAASRSFELQLVDLDGRTNKVPIPIVMEVQTNRAPELKLAAPRTDPRVSPLQELRFQGEVWDDFGMPAYGLTYTIPGKEAVSLTLGTNAPGKEKRGFEHLLKMEELGVQPGQLVSYYIWMEDIGPDGQTRRTAGDMYFAEVRPFEEFFREAQGGQEQSQQEGGGQGNETTKLAELQKEIISATWKLQRQYEKRPLTEQYKKDIEVVRESQEKALEQLAEQMEKANGAETKANLEAVEKEMKAAEKQLADADDSVKPLPGAVASEQAAYQNLLKLAARQYEISRQRNQQAGGGGGGQRNQSQIDQLELQQQENRYETRSQASTPNDPQKREQLQVLNRLKELSQRQQDMNERLKELQNSLNEAKTETEKEEIRRRLKKLREEEQQMLADIDELGQRMDRPENQSQMSDARKQLDNVRDQVQKTAQSLEKEGVSQALSSGTRAQRELQELRDDFKKKNSSQFAEEMKQMRTDARDLARKQEEIAQKLDGLNDPKRKTLGGGEERSEVAKQLEEQKQRLTNLVSRATQVSEQAENVEPLLSRELYDTLRRASQQESKSIADTRDELLQSGRMMRSVYETLEGAKNGAKPAVEATAELLRNGYASEANKLEQRAREGIDELKRGVERAAEKVLGDDTEALRMANRELENLSRQLEQEMARANTNRARASGGQAEGTNSLAQNGRGRGTNNLGGAASGGRDGSRTNQMAMNGGNGREGTNSAAGGRAPRGGQQGQQGEPGERQPGETGQSLAQAPGEQPGPGQQPGQTGEQGQPGGRGQRGQPPGQGEGQGQAQAQAREQGQGQGESGQQQANQGQPGQGQGGQPGQSGQQQAQAGQQPGQGQGEGQGQGQGQGQQGEQGQPGQGQAQAQAGEGQGQGGGARPGGNPNRGPRQRPTLTAQDTPRGAGGTARGGANQPGSPNGEAAGDPLTGEGYVNWSDRLRDVEEMIDATDLRNEVASVRERARAMRQDFRQRAMPPKWDQVQTQILAPLVEVRKRVAEELSKRQSTDSLVPIDRDPVPNQYSELVRKYYERLGKAD